MKLENNFLNAHYDKCMKIQINSDDDLPLEKQ